MPVALSAGDNGTSTTKSAIATAKITITDEAKQKELTGKTAAETIASLNRDTDGAQQTLANDFKPEKINELFSATKTFLQEGNTFMANRTAEADAAKKALAENTDPNAEKTLKDKLTEANKWTPGGDYGRAMTALQAAVGGNVSGGVTGLVQNASVAYLQSIGAEKIKDIADSFQTKKGEENQTSQNVRAALHAIASCAGAAATSSNCSSAAVGAASSVVINNVLSEIENTNADKMTASEKEKRKNLVGSIITGIVAATDGNAAAANNAAQIEMENNYLGKSEATKLEQLTRLKFSGKCDSKCEQETKALKKKDDATNLALDACANVKTPQCDAIRQDVRNAAASYIRSTSLLADAALTFVAKEKEAEATLLAQQSMGGVNTSDVLKGYGQSMVDAAESAYSGAKTAFKALLGDPQAQTQLKAGAGAAWDYVSDLDNLPYLLGAMTPEKREKLAQAYERGDVETIGRIAGETVASLPIGGGAGTIKNVGKATETALDAAQLAKKAEDAANVANKVNGLTKLDGLLGKTIDGPEVTSIMRRQDGHLGERLAIEMLHKETGLTFKPLQNASGHGCDGCLVSINGDKITVVVMDAKSSQNGVDFAKDAAGDPMARLRGWLAKPNIAVASKENRVLIAEIREAMASGDFKIQGITVKVGVPAPGTTGKTAFKVESWPKK
jgi:hypothetical protein